MSPAEVRAGGEQPGDPAGVIFRRMTLADVPRVYEIDQLSFTLPWTERSFRFEVTENDRSLAVVAEVDGQVAAAVVCWLIVDEAHIGTIAVHPAYRRQGIGRRLLACVLLQARARGALTSLLEVRRGNLGAIHLYEGMGYQVVGERPRYYSDNGEDALLMTLPALDETALRGWLAQ